MRIQGMEQEVCQLLLAALGRKIDGRWQGLAGFRQKAASFGSFQDYKIKVSIDFGNGCAI
jgi:hypothetical protein